MMSAMMVMGALGGAGFIISEMMMNSEEVLKKDSKVVAYRQLVHLVKKNLYSGNNCTAALGSAIANPAREAPLDITGGFLGSALNPESSVIRGLPIKVDGGDTVLAAGWKSKTGTSIKDIHFKIDDVVGPPGSDRIVRIEGQPDMKAAYATLIIEPDHKGINIFKKDSSGKYINEDLFIKLYVYYTESAGQKNIVSCFDPASEAAFCTESLQGSFDVLATTADKRCRPDLQCFTYKSGIVNRGTQCPDPYLAVPVGSQFQMCNWCHPEAAPVGSLAGLAFNSADNIADDIDSLATCDANGYGGMTEEEEREVYDDADGSLTGELTPEQRAAYSACLNYTPPPEVPVVADGSTSGSTSGTTSGATSGSGNGNRINEDEWVEDDCGRKVHKNVYRKLATNESCE